MRNEQAGLAGTHNRLYKIWHGMLARCNNPSHSQFHRYGGRGIQVDARWISFKCFFEWAEREHDGVKTLDRRDNDGPYSPENCRWANKKTQSRNRSDNVFYEYQGELKTLPEWAELYDLKVITLVSRVVRMGWAMERALNERPMDKSGIYELNGETMHITEWAKRAGVKPDALYLRMKRGKTLEEALGMKGKK